MAETTNTSGAIAKASTKTVKSPTQTVNTYIKKYEKEIAKALPKVITPERFLRMVSTAVTQTPKLAECTPESFIGCMLTAAQLGVEPNTPLGQAYLIPFKNNKKGVTECQFQLGYKGLIDLAYRSGEVKTIRAHVVYENDVFEYELGLEPKLIHRPVKENRGEAAWYYAVYTMSGDGYGFEVMSREDVLKHAQAYSKTYGAGPWQSNFDEMAKKTVIKKALKYAPLKSDFATATQNDEKVEVINFDDRDINIIPTDGEVIDE